MTWGISKTSTLSFAVHRPGKGAEAMAAAVHRYQPRCQPGALGAVAVPLKDSIHTLACLTPGLLGHRTTPAFRVKTPFCCSPDTAQRGSYHGACSHCANINIIKGFILLDGRGKFRPPWVFFFTVIMLSGTGLNVLFKKDPSKQQSYT